MADTAEARIHGLDGVDRALRALDLKISRRVQLAALRKAAKPMLLAMAAKVPISEDGSHGEAPGTLLKSLGVRAIPKRETRARQTGVVVGPIKSRQYDPWYGHFVEFGTGPHRIQALVRKPARRFRSGLKAGVGIVNVDHPGSPAQPFVRPAFDEAGPLAPAIYGHEIGPRIERAAAKIGAVEAAKVRRALGET